MSRHVRGDFELNLFVISTQIMPGFENGPISEFFSVSRIPFSSHMYSTIKKKVYETEFATSFFTGDVLQFDYRALYSKWNLLFC